VLVLSFSASRTGVMAFVLLMVLWAVQAFPGRRMLALGGSCAVLCASAASLVLLSDQVTRARFAEAVMEFRQLDSGVNLSVPLRANLAVNTLHIIAEHPWLGVGAGDWKSAYADMNARRTPAWNTPRNPHNQLLFATVLTGPIGGALVVALWFVPPWLHRHRRDGLGGLRAGLALLFAAICMAESYFWRSNTGLMFVIFSAMLYGPRHDDARVTSPAQTPRPLA
jgi:O-antigen ligase